MKKLLLLILVLVPVIASAQNLQMHYDFGKDRKYITSTLEMFKPDEYGSTFFFVDFDYNTPGNKSISLSYFEIARYCSLPFIDPKLSATVQYNDGNVNGFSLGQVWLGGFSYPLDLGFVTLNTDLLYRAHHGMDPNAQMTISWFKPFLDGKLVFTGFMDIWSKDKLDNLGENDGKDIVLLTEPQLWYNVWNHLSLGGEIEISNNFIPNSNKVEVMPTLGFKWNF